MRRALSGMLYDLDEAVGRTSSRIRFRTFPSRGMIRYQLSMCSPAEPSRCRPKWTAAAFGPCWRMAQSAASGGYSKVLCFTLRSIGRPPHRLFVLEIISCCYSTQPRRALGLDCCSTYRGTRLRSATSARNAPRMRTSWNGCCWITCGRWGRRRSRFAWCAHGCSVGVLVLAACRSPSFLWVLRGTGPSYSTCSSPTPPLMGASGSRLRLVRPQSIRRHALEPRGPRVDGYLHSAQP